MKKKLLCIFAIVGASYYIQTTWATKSSTSTATRFGNRTENMVTTKKFDPSGDSIGEAPSYYGDTAEGIA